MKIASILLLLFLLPIGLLGINIFSVVSSLVESRLDWSQFPTDQYEPKQVFSQLESVTRYINPFYSQTLSEDFFSKEDVLHLKDVQLIMFIVWASIAFSFILFVHDLKSNLIRSRQVIGQVLNAWIKICAVLIGIGLLFLFFWEQMFILFHRILFPFNDYWMLDPATSNLIKFFPESVFQTLGLLLLCIYVAELLLLWSVNRLLMGKKATIIFTGGHMTPAVAVISKLQSNHNQQYDFLWVGHKYNQQGNKNVSAEYTTITNMGIKFFNLHAGKLSRNWGDGGWIAGLINLIKIPWGFVESLYVVIRYRPKLVISFGGYLALPIVVAARMLGSKVVTHEQTATTGLTNKIIPIFAHRVLISWPSSAKYYPEHKTILTGNPLRPEIFKASSNDFDLNADLPTVYITGGNQGSHKINKAMFAILPELLEIANVIHQTGDSSLTGDLESSLALAKQVQGKLGKYHPKAYIFANQIGEVFAKSSLVVARSGANTVYEILALHKPAIFVPIPWVTHNEQHLNATIAEECGIAKILPEKELSPESLMQGIKDGLQKIAQGQAMNGENIEQVASKCNEVVKLDAADLIVMEVTPYI